MKEDLENLFKDKNLNPNTIKNILLKNPEIFKGLQKIFDSDREKYISICKLVIALLTGLEFRKCENCGKELNYDQTVRGSQFCSNECKLKAGNNPFSKTEIKEKIKKTCLEKYGTDNPAKNKEIKEKIKQTCIKLYGTENGGGTEQSIEKSRKTQEDRYGKLYVRTEECKSKVKTTMNRKFGVNWFTDTDEFKKRNIEYKLDCAWERICSWKNIVIPLFSKEEYQGHSGTAYKQKYKWKCVKCGNKFEDYIHTTGHLKEIDINIPRCIKCFPKHRGFSRPEKEVAEFCRQYFSRLKENDKELLGNRQELDIVIPEIKLAVEFNGCFRHSTDSGKDISYHLNKTRSAESKGFRLIHIWEDEWISDKTEIKRKLADIFTGNEKYPESDSFILSRDWYPKLNIKGYSLEEIPPEAVRRISKGSEFLCFNCGYLKYEKIK